MGAASRKRNWGLGQNSPVDCFATALAKPRGRKSTCPKQESRIYGAHRIGDWGRNPSAMEPRRLPDLCRGRNSFSKSQSDFELIRPSEEVRVPRTSFLPCILFLNFRFLAFCGKSRRKSAVLPKKGEEKSAKSMQLIDFLFWKTCDTLTRAYLKSRKY